MFCKGCGAECSDRAVSCPKCGEPLASSAKSRFLYIVIGLFLSPLGFHDFYIGRYQRGIAWLIYTLALGWLVFPMLLDPVIWIFEIIFTTTDGDGKRLQ